MNVVSFWRVTDQYGYFCQWYKSDFVLTDDIRDKFPSTIKSLSLCKDKPQVLNMLIGHDFVTAEQFMMMGKAALFNDRDVFNKISNSSSPVKQKQLGRDVKNFDEATWLKYCKDIVIVGNYLKFSQSTTLTKNLLNTGDAILIEGSPLDKLWGVGLRFDDPKINIKANWKGLNYLGECLMVVRRILMNK